VSQEHDALSSATFSWTEQGGVLTVTLNRPDRLNAISHRNRDELTRFWIHWRGDAALRCVVLTGAGRAFCAGADMHDLVAQAQPSADIAVALGFLPGRTLDVPVIAAVNGLCVGGGLCFVADADITVAADSAWFSATHVSMGQVGSVGLELAARASVAAVAPSALSGAASRITASTALSRGLVSEVVPVGQLLARAGQLARMIAAQSPEAVRATLRILRTRARGPIERELDDAWRAVVALWSHPDATEGPRAHAEGRRPDWQHPAAGRP
jgi:enoyl-CoA hydratase/carnithine racemase